MSVNRYDSITGQLSPLASGSRIWTGTKAQHDAAIQAGTMPNNCIVVITDDEDGLSTEVTKDDPKAITSGAVYNAVHWKTTTLTFLLNGTGTTGAFNVPAIYKPHDMMILFFNDASYDLSGNWYKASFDANTVGVAANTVYCGELLNSANSYAVSKRLYISANSPTITIYDIDRQTTCNGMIVVPLI